MVIIRILQPFLCFFLLLGFIYLFISLTSWIFIPYSFSRYSVTRYGLTMFSNTLWKKRVPEQPFSSLRRWPGGKFLKLVILSHQANSYTSTNSSCTILLWIEMLWFIIRPIFDSCKVRLWIDKCRSSSWRRHHITGSRGDVFVVRTSKPVENLWKNGLFWSRYSFVTHSIDQKLRDWGLARSAYSSFFLLGTSCLDRSSCDVPCANEDMFCGYWFSKWRTTKSTWVRSCWNADHADCRLQTVHTVQTVQTECYFFYLYLNFLVKFLL